MIANQNIRIKVNICAVKINSIKLMLRSAAAASPVTVAEGRARSLHLVQVPLVIVLDH